MVLVPSIWPFGILITVIALTYCKPTNNSANDEAILGSLTKLDVGVSTYLDEKLKSLEEFLEGETSRTKRHVASGLKSTLKEKSDIWGNIISLTVETDRKSGVIIIGAAVQHDLDDLVVTCPVWTYYANELHSAGSVKVDSPRSVESFQINGEPFLIFTQNCEKNFSDANIRTTHLYKLNGGNLEIVQTFLTTGMTAWKSFLVNEDTFLTGASFVTLEDSYDYAKCDRSKISGSGNVVIYKWIGNGFLKVVTLNVKNVVDVETCSAEGRLYLVLASRFSKGSILIYEINRVKDQLPEFKLLQILPAAEGVLDVECFFARKQLFLAVANEFKASSRKKLSKIHSPIYIFNGLFFELFQNVLKASAKKWTFLNGFLHLQMEGSGEVFSLWRGSWVNIPVVLTPQEYIVANLGVDDQIVVADNTKVSLRKLQVSADGCKELTTKISAVRLIGDEMVEEVQRVSEEIHNDSEMLSIDQLELEMSNLKVPDLSSSLELSGRTLTLWELEAETIVSDLFVVETINSVVLKNYSGNVVTILDGELMSGLHFESVELLNSTVGSNTSDVPLDLVLLDRSNTFTAVKTAKSLSAPDITISGTIDGHQTKDLMLTRGDQTILGDLVLNYVKVKDIRSRLINGIDWFGDVLSVDKGGVVNEHKTFIQAVDIEKDLKVLGNVNGIPSRRIEKMVRIDEDITVTVPMNWKHVSFKSNITIVDGNVIGMIDKRNVMSREPWRRRQTRQLNIQTLECGKVEVQGRIVPPIPLWANKALKVSDKVLEFNKINFAGKVNFRSIQLPQDIFQGLIPLSSDKTFVLRTNFANSVKFTTDIEVDDLINDVDVVKLNNTAVTLEGKQVISGKVEFKEEVSASRISFQHNHSDVVNLEGPLEVSTVTCGSLVTRKINGHNENELFEDVLNINGQQVVTGWKTFNSWTSRDASSNLMVDEKLMVDGVNFLEFISDALLHSAEVKVLKFPITFTNTVKFQDLHTDQINGVAAKSLYEDVLLKVEERVLRVEAMTVKRLHAQHINGVNVEGLYEDTVLKSSHVLPDGVSFRQIVTENTLSVTTLCGIMFSQYVVKSVKGMEIIGKKTFKGHVHVCGDLFIDKETAFEKLIPKSLSVHKVVFQDDVTTANSFCNIDWKSFFQNAIFIDSPIRLKNKVHLVKVDVASVNITGLVNGFDLQSYNMFNSLDNSSPVTINFWDVVTFQHVVLRHLDVDPEATVQDLIPVRRSIHILDDITVENVNISHGEFQDSGNLGNVQVNKLVVEGKIVALDDPACSLCLKDKAPGESLECLKCNAMNDLQGSFEGRFLSFKALKELQDVQCIFSSGKSLFALRHTKDFGYYEIVETRYLNGNWTLKPGNVINIKGELADCFHSPDPKNIIIGLSTTIGSNTSVQFWQIKDENGDWNIDIQPHALDSDSNFQNPTVTSREVKGDFDTMKVCRVGETVVTVRLDEGHLRVTSVEEVFQEHSTTSGSFLNVECILVDNTIWVFAESEDSVHIFRHPDYIQPVQVSGHRNITSLSSLSLKGIDIILWKSTGEIFWKLNPMFEVNTKCDKCPAGWEAKCGTNPETVNLYSTVETDTTGEGIMPFHTETSKPATFALTSSATNKETSVDSVMSMTSSALDVSEPPLNFESSRSFSKVTFPTIATPDYSKSPILTTQSKQSGSEEVTILGKNLSRTGSDDRRNASTPYVPYVPLSGVKKCTIDGTTPADRKCLIVTLLRETESTDVSAVEEHLTKDVFEELAMSTDTRTAQTIIESTITDDSIDVLVTDISSTQIQQDVSEGITGLLEETTVAVDSALPEDVTLLDATIETDSGFGGTSLSTVDEKTTGLVEYPGTVTSTFTVEPNSSAITVSTILTSPNLRLKTTERSTSMFATLESNTAFLKAGADLEGTVPTPYGVFDIETASSLYSVGPSHTLLTFPGEASTSNSTKATDGFQSGSTPESSKEDASYRTKFKIGFSGSTTLKASLLLSALLPVSSASIEFSESNTPTIANTAGTVDKSGVEPEVTFSDLPTQTPEDSRVMPTKTSSFILKGHETRAGTQVSSVHPSSETKESTENIPDWSQTTLAQLPVETTESPVETSALDTPRSSPPLPEHNRHVTETEDVKESGVTTRSSLSRTDTDEAGTAGYSTEDHTVVKVEEQTFSLYTADETSTVQEDKTSVVPTVATTLLETVAFLLSSSIELFPDTSTITRAVEKETTVPDCQLLPGCFQPELARHSPKSSSTKSYASRTVPRNSTTVRTTPPEKIRSVGTTLSKVEVKVTLPPGRASTRRELNAVTTSGTANPSGVELVITHMPSFDVGDIETDSESSHPDSVITDPIDSTRSETDETKTRTKPTTDTGEVTSETAAHWSPESTESHVGTSEFSGWSLSPTLQVTTENVELYQSSTFEEVSATTDESYYSGTSSWIGSGVFSEYVTEGQIEEVSSSSTVPGTMSVYPEDFGTETVDSGVSASFSDVDLSRTAPGDNEQTERISYVSTEIVKANEVGETVPTCETITGCDFNEYPTQTRISTKTNPITKKTTSTVPATRKTTTTVPASTRKTTSTVPTSTGKTTTTVPTSTRKTTTPVPASFRKTTTPVPTSTRKTTLTVPISARKTTTPVPASFRKTTTPVSTSTRMTTSTVPTSTGKATTPVPMSTRKTTSTVPISTRKTTTTVPASFRKTTTPVPTSTRKSVTPVPTSTGKFATSVPASIWMSTKPVPTPALKSTTLVSTIHSSTVAGTVSTKETMHTPSSSLEHSVTFQSIASVPVETESLGTTFPASEAKLIVLTSGSSMEAEDSTVSTDVITTERFMETVSDITELPTEVETNTVFTPFEGMETSGKTITESTIADSTTKGPVRASETEVMQTGGHSEVEITISGVPTVTAEVSQSTLKTRFPIGSSITAESLPVWSSTAMMPNLGTETVVTESTFLQYDSTLSRHFEQVTALPVIGEVMETSTSKYASDPSSKAAFTEVTDQFYAGTSYLDGTDVWSTEYATELETLEDGSSFTQPGTPTTFFETFDLSTTIPGDSASKVVFIEETTVSGTAQTVPTCTSDCSPSEVSKPSMTSPKPIPIIQSSTTSRTASKGISTSHLTSATSTTATHTKQSEETPAPLVTSVWSTVVATLPLKLIETPESSGTMFPTTSVSSVGTSITVSQPIETASVSNEHATSPQTMDVVNLSWNTLNTFLTEDTVETTTEYFTEAFENLEDISTTVSSVPSSLLETTYSATNTQFREISEVTESSTELELMASSSSTDCVPPDVLESMEEHLICVPSTDSTKDSSTSTPTSSYTTTLITKSHSSTSKPETTTKGTVPLEYLVKSTTAARITGMTPTTKDVPRSTLSHPHEFETVSSRPISSMITPLSPGGSTSSETVRQTSEKYVPEGSKTDITVTTLSVVPITLTTSIDSRTTVPSIIFDESTISTEEPVTSTSTLLYSSQTESGKPEYFEALHTTTDEGHLDTSTILETGADTTEVERYTEDVDLTSPVIQLETETTSGYVTDETQDYMTETSSLSDYATQTVPSCAFPPDCVLPNVPTMKHLKSVPTTVYGTVPTRDESTSKLTPRTSPSSTVESSRTYSTRSQSRSPPISEIHIPGVSPTVSITSKVSSSSTVSKEFLTPTVTSVSKSTEYVKQPDRSETSSTSGFTLIDQETNAISGKEEFEETEIAYSTTQGSTFPELFSTIIGETPEITLTAQDNWGTPDQTSKYTVLSERTDLFETRSDTLTQTTGTELSSAPVLVVGHTPEDTTTKSTPEPQKLVETTSTSLSKRTTTTKTSSSSQETKIYTGKTREPILEGTSSSATFHKATTSPFGTRRTSPTHGTMGTSDTEYETVLSSSETGVTSDVTKELHLETYSMFESYSTHPENYFESTGTSDTPWETDGRPFRTDVMPLGTDGTPLGTGATDLDTSAASSRTDDFPLGTDVTNLGKGVTTFEPDATLLGRVVTRLETDVKSPRTATSSLRTATSSLRTATSSLRTATTSSGTDTTPSGTDATPSGTDATPAGTDATPSVHSPSRPDGTPSRTVATPSRTVVTPSRTVVTLSRTAATPSRRVHTPSRTDGTPSRTDGTPSRTAATPSRTDSTPSRTDSTPSRTDSTPSRTDSTPSRTDSTPSRTDSTPSRTDSTPSRTDSTPSRTEAISRTDSSPASPFATSLRTDITPLGTDGSSAGTDGYSFGTDDTTFGTDDTTFEPDATPLQTDDLQPSTIFAPLGTDGIPLGTVTTSLGRVASLETEDTPPGRGATPPRTFTLPSITDETAARTDTTSQGTDVTPPKTIASPSRTDATPSRTDATFPRTFTSPSETDATSQRTDATSQRTDATASTTIATPLTTLATPSTTLATPSTTLATPSTTLATPSTTLATPSTTLATPSTTLATPSTTLATPSTTLATPSTTLATPSTTLATPSTTLTSLPGTVATPQKIFTSPSGTDATSSKTYASPPGTVATPSRTDGPARRTRTSEARSPNSFTTHTLFSTKPTTLSSSPTTVMSSGTSATSTVTPPKLQFLVTAVPSHHDTPATPMNNCSSSDIPTEQCPGTPLADFTETVDTTESYSSLSELENVQESTTVPGVTDYVVSWLSTYTTDEEGHESNFDQETDLSDAPETVTRSVNEDSVRVKCIFQPGKCQPDVVTNSYYLESDVEEEWGPDKVTDLPSHIDGVPVDLVVRWLRSRNYNFKKRLCQLIGVCNPHS